MRKFVVFGIIICLIVVLISGCGIDYEDGIPVLREAWGEEGEIIYDASSQTYVINMYYEGLFDILYNCAILGNLQPWKELVNSANVLSAEMHKVAPYPIGVTINYYDTSGTLLISSHAGQTMYDASRISFK